MTGGQRLTGFRRLRRRAKLAVFVPLVRKMFRSRAWARVVPRLPRFAQMILGGWWVTGYDEVVDVLRRDREFGMTYLARMEQLGTPFILGMNPSPSYHRQSAALWDAFAGIDLERVGQQARDHADSVLAASDGSIDLIEHLTDPVLARTVGAELWSGAELTQGQIDDARAISRDIFINPFEDPKVRDRAEAATPRLRGHISGLAKERRTATPRPAGQPGDVLDRLLDAGELDDDELIDDLLGVTVAWVTSVSRTMAHAFDELLRPERSQELARAQAAARGWDVKTVGEILFEALRFRPSMPALERVCTREARVGQRTIRRNEKLMLVLTAAMLDDRGIPHADEFRAGRPCEQYLHFGHKTHHCLGEAVARVQMQEIAAALLRRPNTRQVRPLEADGPFPRHLVVAFDRVPS